MTTEFLHCRGSAHRCDQADTFKFGLSFSLNTFPVSSGRCVFSTLPSRGTLGLYGQVALHLGSVLPLRGFPKTMSSAVLLVCGSVMVCQPGGVRFTQLSRIHFHQLQLRLISSLELGCSTLMKSTWHQSGIQLPMSTATCDTWQHCEIPAPEQQEQQALPCSGAAMS